MTILKKLILCYSRDTYGFPQNLSAICCPAINKIHFLLMISLYGRYIRYELYTLFLLTLYKHTMHYYIKNWLKFSVKKEGLKNLKNIEPQNYIFQFFSVHSKSDLKQLNEKSIFFVWTESPMIS